MADGEPWFVSQDVCDALGLLPNRQNRSYQDHYRRLPSEERRTMVLPHSSETRACISESGLYKLVMRSDKPQAKPFQDWVTKTVLPSIRKDGAYVMGEEKLKTGEMSAKHA